MIREPDVFWPERVQFFEVWLASKKETKDETDKSEQAYKKP